MKVIPAINCENFHCVSGKIVTAAAFSDWVQVDVSDGKFSDAVTWNNPKELFSFMHEHDLATKVEVHLMVEDVLGESLRWLAAGAKRVIVQAGVEFDVDDFFKSCGEYRAEAMLSFSSKLNMDEYSGLLSKFSEFQILSVPPGFAGQEFDKNSIDKIKSLRELFPSAIIEVDGGINPETARLVKSAGADIIASASYIFNGTDPASAFKKLNEI